MTLAIVQARMGSKRLPGKALAPLAGQPLIWRQLERLKGARTLTRIVVATSNEPADDALAAWLVSQGQAVFRGAPSDLLDRFARCAVSAGPASHVVRIKGDAPFVDPRVIDEAVRMAKVSGASEFGSQWFINVKDNPSLDYNNPSGNKFYPFAEVVSGMDVVDAIANAPTQGEKPNPPITISTITIEAK